MSKAQTPRFFDEKKLKCLHVQNALRRVITRKSIYVFLTAVTLGLLAITIWTGGISNTITSQTWQSATDTFHYIADSPLEGQMTISAPNQMYERVPYGVYFNITLTIPDSTPMNLTITDIECILTPLDYKSRGEPDLPKVIGENFTTRYFENVTSVNIEGTVEIRPLIITGENYLGCGVEYLLKNGSFSEECEGGINCWGGIDGVIFMIPVTVYPLFYQLQGWFFGFIGTLIVWGIILLHKFRKG